MSTTVDRAGSGEPSQQHGSHRFAITALIAWSVVFVIVCLGAFVFGGTTLGLGALALSAKDYKPSVIGIKEYHYEPSGDAYNLFFEQFSSSTPGSS